MTVNRYLVAFPASPRLYQNTRAFVDAVRAEPEVSHQALLDGITEDFITEVLNAFFDGPVQALGVTGSMARVMDGVVSIISRAARTMTSKVFRNVSIEEQYRLAEHFDAIEVTRDGRSYCAFPLDPELANEAVLMFEMFRQGNGQPEQLQKVMRAICDGAIEYYFDRSVGCVSVGRFTRGLVSTGRATIAKAAHSALEKTLPGLHPKARQPVLDYFERMLMEAA